MIDLRSPLERIAWCVLVALAASCSTQPEPPRAVAPSANGHPHGAVAPAPPLAQDVYDTPAAASVAEAAKAAQPVSHAAPGEVHATPPAHGHDPRPAAEEKPHRHPAAKAVVYTCPMHPEVISDKPGSCPKCGMTLVKKK